MKFRKLKQKKQTNKPTKVNILYAKYPERIKALITDMFMIYMPIMFFITYVILSGKNAFLDSIVAPLIATSLYGIIYAIFLSKTGQTPGKKAYDIKVVDYKSQKNLSFMMALCRFIAFLFSATIIIGLFIPFFRKDNKTLHDLICGTIEIKI
ncbi:RDD family protein [Sulfurimonas sp. SAG-AH-194-L11]|nr:RDD family protein [Sulfurimonas sp. SAG-AH-194-L11]MDF1877460.1 RDD family protein [Sulfurimonas sp. SAG-AH-194-L11]